MKFNKKLLIIGSSMSCLVIVLIAAFSIKSFDVSYALQTDSDGLPTQSFHSNVSSSNPTTLNLVGDALSSNSSYNSSILGSFKIVSNIKDTDEIYPLYTLSKNKLVPTSSELFEVGTEYNNPAAVDDLVISTLLQLGYSNVDNAKTIFNKADLISKYGTVTDNAKKQYITQLAIWVYLYKNKDTYESSYCSNNNCVFYQEDGTDNPAIISYDTVKQAIDDAAENSNYKYLGYVNDLIGDAENILTVSSGNSNQFGNSLGNYTYYKDNNNEYILTGEFKLNSINTISFINWDVSVIDPNNYGIYITDVNGDRLDNLNNLSKSTIIKLHIPITGKLTSMDLNTSGIKVTINSLNPTQKIHIFRVTHTDNGSLLLGSGGTKEERFSNALLGLTKTTSNDSSFYLHNFTVISKVDATSGNEISGAHLVIYNASDIDSQTKLPVSNARAIAEWDSVEGESHKLSLDDGSYGLCETIAPKNYQPLTTCVTFSVDNAQAVSAYKLENVPVPDTALFNSNLPYKIGGLLVALGVLGMIFIVKSNKKSGQQEDSQELI